MCIHLPSLLIGKKCVKCFIFSLLQLKLIKMKRIKKSQLHELDSWLKSLSPMWMVIFCIIFSFLFVSHSSGQTPKTQTFSPYAHTTYIKFSDGSYSNSDDNKVGYELISGNNYKFYRRALQFSIGTIPSNSTITSCQLDFASGIECGIADGTIVFTKLRWDWPTLFDNQQVFNLIYSGTTVNSISINAQANYNIALNSLVADIQSAIMSSYPYIGLGAYNQYESINYGTSFSNQVLTINYTIPTPSAPTNLAVSSITAGSFVLSWTAPTGNVTGYKVYKNGVYYNSTTSTNMYICGLLPSSSYSMYVIAYNSYGDGDPSDTKSGGPTQSSAISGPPLICTAESYSVNNVPSGATITWSTQSSNITVASGQQNSNPCSFQKVSNGNGTIDAAITSGCENYTLTFQVHTGPYSSSDYPISGPSSAQCLSYVYYSIPTLSGVTSINWTWPSGWTYVSGQNSAYLALRTGTSGGTVAVGVNNTCGQSGSYATKYTSVYGSCGYSLIISPNPASDVVNVTIQEPQLSETDSTATMLSSEGLSNKSAVYKFIIADNMGVVYSSFNKNSKSFTLSVQNLKNGNYILIATDGVNKFSAHLIVMH